jgi:hypothetical protein
MPDVQDIAPEAFSYSRSLKSIEVGALEHSVAEIFGLKAAGSNAFLDEELEYKYPLGLETIKIHGGKIPSSCFQGCPVTNVILQEGVSALGGWSFYKMPNIKEIIVPASVASISEGAFGGYDNKVMVRFLQPDPSKISFDS